jgi:hypothetical protein
MFRFIVSLLLCTIAISLRANIVINEVLAFNRNAHANGVDYPDVIELYNTGVSSVDISGFALTDNPATPGKYMIPGTTIIAGGGYLIIYADSALASPGLHTSFGLNSDGDSLYLMSGATVLDSVTFGTQAPDVSIGRIPNGTGAFQANTPTIGTTNATITLGAITNVKVNEWMAKPFTGSDWFEIYNNDSKPVSISGMWLSNNAGTPKISQMPVLSFIEGKGFQKFWSDKLPALGPTHVNFRLSATGTSIVLTQSNGTSAIDRITFGTQTQDVSQGRVPDGAGTIVSMPGSSSPQNPNYALNTIVINEVMANAAAPFEDAIELYNTGTTAVNVGGWWLSDDLVNRKKYQIPANTVMQPGGYLVIYEHQMLAGAVPFSLLARGDEVMLSAVDSGGNLTGYGALVRFGAADENVSIGRVPATGLGASNGTAEFWRQSAHTFGEDNAGSVATFRTGAGEANAGPRIGPVTINEIMYHPTDQPGTPPVDVTTTEFIELYNITNAPIDVTGWRLKGDSEFLMPSGASIPAHGFILLVSFDPVVDTASLATFKSTYGLGATPAIYGPYSQKLSNATMSVEFAKPLTVDGVSTFANVDKVEYRGSAPWPITPDGTGHSLQRSNTFVIGNTASNWTGAAPTPGAVNSGVVSTFAIGTSSPLVGGVVSTPYSTALNAVDGFAPFTFTKLTGTLPPTLTLSPAGVLSGTPNTAGTYNFTIQVQDSLGRTSSKAFSIIIAATAPSITTSTPLPNGTTGSPYSQTFAATGGTSPYTWSIASGTAPSGLTLSSAGVLSGIPLTAGTFNFTVQATDTGLLTTTKVVALTIAPSPITITTGSILPGAVKGVDYLQTLSATGGATPYVWSLFSGTLPAPCVINNNGIITGKPTTPGVYTFTAQLQDNNGVIAAKAFTLTVYATYQIPVLNPITLGSTTVGASFSYPVIGINYPKTFSATGLPSGITINATTGLISGRAKVSGLFNLQIKATNSAGSSTLITAPLVVKALSPNVIGSYTGIIGRDSAANGNLGARLTLTTSIIGTYTAKITKGATTLSTPVGYLAPSAPQINITIGGQLLSLTLDPLSSLVSGTHGSASVDGWRSTWSATLNPASSRAGYYSMGIGLADSGDIGQTNIPQGSGYASFVVSSAGILTVAGKTADGSAISSAGFIGPHGEIAVYASLYGSLGTVHGKLMLSEDVTGGFADNSVAGAVTWSKPLTTARAYKAAFGPINLNAYGKYLAPAASGYIVLGLPNVGSASLGFSQGGISAVAISPNITFTYTASNTTMPPTFASGNNPAKTTLTINKSTGLVTGTFTLVDPAPTGTRIVSYSGMIVRPASGTSKARGYFLLPQIPTVGQTITTSPILSGMMQVTP